MEPLEFLGGKYQEPEQIVPGEVQTFRAREANTGRVVFVHRVSTAGGDAQQAALLRLVLLGLFRSSSARSQVLDFGEEPGFCYVVTESSPHCLLLREWLQFELESAIPGRPGQAPQPLSGAPVPAEPKPPADRPAANRPETKATVEAKVGPVAFVIREQPARPAAAPPTPPPSQAAPGVSLPPRVEIVKKEPVPAGPPKPQPPTWDLDPEPTKMETRIEPAPPKVERAAAKVEPPPPKAEPPAPKPEPVAPPVEPAPAGPSQSEPGEFTRFFKGGLPPSAPSRLEAFRSQDRPSHGFGPVQRPSNPPSIPPKNEPGEFTRMFMKSGGEPATPTAPAPQSPKPPVNTPSNRTGFPDDGEFGSNNSFNSPRVERLPDLSNRPGELPSMFQMNAEAPTPMRSAAQEPGEYTRMFGKGGVPPPPQAPSALGPAPNFRTDDPLGGTNFGMPAASAPAAPPPPSGPSEFTRMMMGTRAQEPTGGQGAPGTTAPPAGGAPGGFGAPPSMGKPPAMPGQMPGMGGAPAAPAGGQAQMPSTGPSGHGGQPMGGGMGGVQVTPINPMHAMGGAGMGQGVSTNLGGMGSAGASMGNPMLGQAGHMGIMTPLGRAQIGGGSMQSMGQPGAPAGHPGAAGPGGGGHGMPGKMPGALPQAPTTGLGSKGKLLILFAVLGVLAIAMVLFVIFATHK